MKLDELEEFYENKKKVIRVGVVGSRRRNSDKDHSLIYSYGYSLIRKAKKANAELIFVSGGCKEGADSFIKSFCENHKIQLIEHLPKLEGLQGHNKNYWMIVEAYYARNKLIAEDSNFIIAMVAADRTGGTENTIKYAEELGKDVILI